VVLIFFVLKMSHKRKTFCSQIAVHFFQKKEKHTTQSGCRLRRKKLVWKSVCKIGSCGGTFAPLLKKGEVAQLVRACDS
jgi:hypothetical protein